MIPIYRSDGEWVAAYEKGFVYGLDGEWLGFVVGREVFDTGGSYLGFLSDDQRLLRKRTRPIDRPIMQPPPSPPRLVLPAAMPLPPLFPTLPHQIIDMFEEFPEKLSHISETRPDMD